MLEKPPILQQEVLQKVEDLHPKRKGLPDDLCDGPVRCVGHMLHQQVLQGQVGPLPEKRDQRLQLLGGNVLPTSVDEESSGVEEAPLSKYLAEKFPEPNGKETEQSC